MQICYYKTGEAKGKITRPMEDPDNGGTNMQFKILRNKMFKMG